MFWLRGKMRLTDSESLWTPTVLRLRLPILRPDSKQVRGTWKSPSATITYLVCPTRARLTL